MTGEREQRAEFFLRAEAYTPYVAVESGDEVYFVATDDVGVGKDLFARRSRIDLRVLAEALGLLAEAGVALPDEPLFVDVGANIGTTTVAAIRRHGFASAVSIEPSPQNVRTLRLNLVANDIDGKVHVVQAAASDSETELRLALSPGTSGENEVVAADAEDALPVRAVTLDGLVGGGAIDPDRVGMLWIDAQGHETSVLRGARGLLARGVPLVCAVRRVRGWEETVASLPELLGGYTHVFRLRKQGRRYPIDELGEVLEAVSGGGDLLAVRL